MGDVDTASLVVYRGPMFSGKTSALIAALETRWTSGLKVCAFAPSRDTRRTDGWIESHDGRRWPARTVSNAEEILDYVDGALFVGIDEANMYGGDLIRACLTLVSRGVKVHVAGLDLDHLGRPFEPLPALLCFAHAIITLTARCACGALARWSKRLVADDGLIVPGGSESYVARCTQCFWGNDAAAA